MKTLPHALFIIDINEETTATREALKKDIPIAAILNSDCDPSLVDYPIPANDNAHVSIEYFIKKAREAYLRGKATAITAEGEVVGGEPEITA